MASTANPSMEKTPRVLSKQPSVLTRTETKELDRIDPKHDGHLSGKTLRDAARLASGLRASNLLLKKGIFVTSVVLLISWLGNFGLVFVAVNLSKDLKVEDGSLKGSDGGSIRTHNQKNVYTVTLPTVDSRRRLSEGVATVPWAAVNLAILSIENGETGAVINIPLCDGSNAAYSMASTVYYRDTDSEGYFGIKKVHLNNDDTVSYDVSCKISSTSDPDYVCPVVTSSCRRRALSFEDAFDGDIDAHAKHTRRLETKELELTDDNSCANITVMPLGHVMLLQGDDLTAAIADESVTVIQLVGGNTSYDWLEGQVVTGRDLTITAINPGSDDDRVKINVVKAAVVVSATLRLVGLDLATEIDGQLVSKGGVPLLELREDGHGEIIQSELRVLAGEPAIDSVNGSVMLRQTTIFGVVRSDESGSCLAADPSFDQPLVRMDGSDLELDFGVSMLYSEAEVPIAQGRLLAEPNTPPVGRSLSEDRVDYVAVIICNPFVDPCCRRPDCGQLG